MKKLFYLFAVFLLIGCQPENEIETVEQTEQKSERIALEESVGEESAFVSYRGVELPVSKIDGSYIYGGDILIPEDTEEVKIYEPGEKVNPTKAAALKSNYWDNGVIFYDIDPSLQHFAIERIMAAMEWFRNNTNLTFKQSTDAGGYVYFTAGGGCSSYVGKIGNKQEINVGSGFEYWRTCPTGSIMHEIMHAIGFWHEHSRIDRDEYVDIFWENIDDRAHRNFYKINSSTSMDIGEALDYNSIMMYGSLAFSINKEYTMLKKDGDVLPYNRTAPSEKDLEAINMLYPAEGVEPTYVNGEWYTMYGLTVLRFYDNWYWPGPFGMKAVKLVNGVWYYR